MSSLFVFSLIFPLTLNSFLFVFVGTKFASNFPEFPSLKLVSYYILNFSKFYYCCSREYFVLQFYLFLEIAQKRINSTMESCQFWRDDCLVQSALSVLCLIVLLLSLEKLNLDHSMETELKFKIEQLRFLEERFLRDTSLIDAIHIVFILLDRF